jgi:hypothetical protein
MMRWQKIGVVATGALLWLALAFWTFTQAALRDFTPCYPEQCAARQYDLLIIPVTLLGLLVGVWIGIRWIARTRHNAN